MYQEAPVRSVFAEITDFLATNPTPEAIIAYRLPVDLQERAHELLEKNGEDELTELEREEMLDFVRIDQMLSLLKVKMRVTTMAVHVPEAQSLWLKEKQAP